MDWKREWKKLVLIAAVFLGCFYLPVGFKRFDGAIMESLHLVRWYAREHVLLCLVPAFFIAGAISVFVSQASVMKYLGAKANKVLAYGVASVSGSILAVCSCTILPLFAGIYKMGAGLGPATAFLYSGPAINVLAIILTARVLGLELGIARAVGAIVFSIVIGLLMHLIYRKEEAAKANVQMASPEPEVKRPLWKNAVYFASMVGILVFANWARSGDVRAVFLCCPGGLTTYQVEGTLVDQTDETVTIVDTTGKKQELPAELLQDVEEVRKNNLYETIHRIRWVLVAGLLVAFLFMVGAWFGRGEIGEWVEATWGFAKQILPLLLLGVLVAGFLLGRPGHEGIIPTEWVNRAVGTNSVWANLFAAVAGAFMYFATLTEVPILQGLMGAGMAKGPALALLLAGPALSLPNMLVIRSVMGTQKTAVFVALVIVMATISGMIFGTLF
ncbi:permease [Anaerobaca lacustris]|uniref:Permease n=1 Tax=Anaerobaca lacustris TaxID=3044600 RepID=A0AAW6U573_9BACT|nr:permease [Sedimentisphaerales bacterium M17dextr]